jgi:hypothetical protein
MTSRRPGLLTLDEAIKHTFQGWLAETYFAAVVVFALETPRTRLLHTASASLHFPVQLFCFKWPPRQDAELRWHF